MWRSPCQVLYVDAVCYFPSELAKVVEVMEEKEIRMRAPVEEVQLLLGALETGQAGK